MSQDDAEEQQLNVQDDDGGQENAEASTKSKNKKYRRDKPWDVEGIDHWKVRVCALPRRA
jgi:ribosomal RNA assembly protein